jgi:hypothetical protein
MLFREAVVVYCENHTEHVKYINILCGQNAEFFNLKKYGASCFISSFYIINSSDYIALNSR